MQLRKYFCAFILFGQFLSAQQFRTQQLVSAPGDSVHIDLTSMSSLDGASITLRNSGTDLIRIPQIANPGIIWPSNVETVIQQIQPRGSDQDIAIQAWQYVTMHTFHACSAGTRTSQGTTTFTTDPALLTNAFGFGCCDQLSRVLAWIWQGLGYQTRLALFSFHTVPEVYYGGSWHMLDPDRQIYYLQNDNVTIAGIADILNDPGIVARAGTDPFGDDQTAWAKLFIENASTLRLVDSDFLANSGLELALRPHEQLTMHSENRAGLIQSYFTPPAPLFFQNANSGQFDWDLSFGDSNWQSHAYSVSGADVLTDQTGTAYLRATSAGPGEVVYKESSPFPVLRLSLMAQTSSGDGALNVYISNNGVQWSEPVSLQDASDVSSFQKYADLSSQATGYFSYFIKVELQPGARLRKLRISPVVQLSKFLFPALVTGTANDLIYNDLSPSVQPRMMRVTTRIPGRNPAIRGLQASSLVTEDPFHSLAQDHGSSNIVDGDPDSYAGTGSNHLDYSIRLNAIYHITAVSIDWNDFGTDPRLIKSWTLSGRNGNQPWQALASGARPGVSSSNMDVDTVATELRLVADGSSSIGIYELRAFGTLLQPLQAVFAEVKSATTPQGQPLLRPGSSDLASKLPQTDNLDFAPSFVMQQRTTFLSETHLSALQITWPDIVVRKNAVQNWIVEERAGADQPWRVVASGDGVNSSVTLVFLDCISTELRVTATSTLIWSGSYNVGLFGASRLRDVTAFSLSVDSLVPGFGPAGNLADGDPETSAYPGATFFDYLLDPGQPTSIDAVRVIWGGFGTDAGYINSWQLMGLPEESTTWQVIRRGGSPGASETLVPVQGRYRKLRIAAQSTLNWIGINEVHVFGASIEPITAESIAASLPQSTMESSSSTSSIPPGSSAPSESSARTPLHHQNSAASAKPGVGSADVTPLRSIPTVRK